LPAGDDQGGNAWLAHSDPPAVPGLTGADGLDDDEPGPGRERPSARPGPGYRVDRSSGHGHPQRERCCHLAGDDVPTGPAAGCARPPSAWSSSPGRRVRGMSSPGQTLARHLLTW